jgi:hypothetical protein
MLLLPLQHPPMHPPSGLLLRPLSRLLMLLQIRWPSCASASTSSTGSLTGYGFWLYLYPALYWGYLYCATGAHGLHQQGGAGTTIHKQAISPISWSWLTRKHRQHLRTTVQGKKLLV